MAIANFTEDISSHIPAVHLLMNLGYEYITPEQTITLRDGKKSRVVLVDVLKVRSTLSMTKIFKMLLIKL
jgi:type I restriction enzyme R subunit